MRSAVQKPGHVTTLTTRRCSYFQPIRDLTTDGPVKCNLHDADAAQNHRPRSCPDPALTAFCQLAALRLESKRAMLFFFDLNAAYVLAEATRSLSLQDDSVHDFEDDLWLGHTVIPRGLSVCEDTVMMSPDRTPATERPPHPHDAYPATIINDLSEDTRFCDRPFVTFGPKARFYAGVPITTPKGIHIGAFCILDDKTRNGLSEKEVQFLRDMSATIMTHLEMVRANAELARGAKMVTGLGTFIDTASRSREIAQGDLRRREPQLKTETSGEKLEVHLLKTELPIREKNPVTTLSDAVASSASAEDTPVQRSQEVIRSEAPRRAISKRTGSSAAVQTRNRSSMNQIFDLAAEIVREAIDVDGVTFLDPSSGVFGTVMEGSGVIVDSSNGSLGETAGNHKDPSTPRSLSFAERGGADSQPCRILASSTGTSSIFDGALDQEPGVTPTTISEATLRSLLRRFPRGKVWYFNNIGSVSDEESSDESPDSGGDLNVSPHPVEANDNRSPHNGSGGSHVRRRDHAEDTRAIKAAFPQAHSVAVIGMWDHTRGRWYAACAFWSRSPLRPFSEEFEVKYVQAFCDVIFAELQRLEAETSNRAKSDFISTISHELRSPLHGILGTVECLQEQPLDMATSDMISQIEICGRTLIDIIDHLLDFSKINHQPKPTSGGALIAGGRTQRPSLATRETSTSAGFMASESDIALDRITEETVETAVYSFCCSREPEMILARQVAVTLDIDRAAEIDWRCNIATGAWKRIVINLVSNALKYTDQGHIRISLSAKRDPKSRQGLTVLLRVSDSGRGMSKEFLERDLFRAFSQEDSFVEGTGLGLNLVAKIVKALDGQIEVQSEKDVGTCFSVTLAVDQNSPRQVTRKFSEASAHSSYENVSVAIAEAAGDAVDPFIQSDVRPPSGEVVLSSIKRTLLQAGITTMPSAWPSQQDASIVLLTESEFEAGMIGAETPQDATPDPVITSSHPAPLIVVCNSEVSARRLRASQAVRSSQGHVVLIAQPIGPERLLKAVRSCLTVKENDARLEQQATGSQGNSDSRPPTARTLPEDDPSAPPALEQIDAAHLNPRTIGLNLNLDLTFKLQNEATGGVRQVSATAPISMKPVQPASEEQLVGITAKPNDHSSRKRELSILLVDDNVSRSIAIHPPNLYMASSY